VDSTPSGATTRTWAEIDLGALRQNFELARGTGRKVMCIIKADAYGHGAVPCGLFLEAHGADAFGVACLAEAVKLRQAGLKRPILILGHTPPQEASVLAELGLSQTVLDESFARELAAQARDAGVQVSVHVKLDTGLSRLGLPAQGPDQGLEAARAMERLEELGGLVVDGLYTHFAAADTKVEEPFTAWQLENYMRVLEELNRRGLRPTWCHTSNSACILSHPETQLNMIREGIILYGLYPDSTPRCGPLRPVMTLKSRVVLVRRLPVGASVSYGRTWRASTETTCAVVAAGYADGYPRRLSNQAWILLNGQRHPQIGRVCMDMSMFDVTGSEVQPGDEVVLFGQGGMSLEEVANVVGTINYEIASLVTNRVPRVYLNGQEEGT
jgi:alanine racemase